MPGGVTLKDLRAHKFLYFKVLLEGVYISTTCYLNSFYSTHEVFIAKHKYLTKYLFHLYTAIPKKITVKMMKVAIDKITMIVCEEESVMRTRVIYLLLVMCQCLLVLDGGTLGEGVKAIYNKTYYTNNSHILFYSIQCIY